jgi:osmotically-inducible protein OsmY
MTRSAVHFRAGPFLLLFLFLITPFAASAQTEAIDLTATFLNGGVAIDNLLVYQIGGIVVIRGRTGDMAMARNAGRFATTRGYPRVANLIQIIAPADDMAIQRFAERGLGMQRQLDGCRFSVDSQQGVVRLAGRVREEAQKDIAVKLLSRIDGVTAVHSTLTRF